MLLSSPAYEFRIRARPSRRKRSAATLAPRCSTPTRCVPTSSRRCWESSTAWPTTKSCCTSAASFTTSASRGAFDHPARSFEMVSADVAAELAERHRWALTRRYTVHRAIVLHMSPTISQAELPEVLLLEAGVACDVTGARIQDVSRRAVTEVLRRYSRADFARQFSATLQDEARRKPGCAAAHLFELGLQRRIDEAPFTEQ